jgi:hypothetical protein
LIDDSRHMRGGTKHVDQIDRERNVGQAGIRLLAQHFVHQRPHRHDAEAIMLHRLRHPVARACRLRRQSDDGDGSDAVE